MQRALLLLKSAVFTVLVPGTVAILVPHYLAASRGRSLFPALALGNALAYVVFVAGAGVCLCCMWDFVYRGFGTPMPIAPPTQLVVQGFYRWTRNPMYNGVLLVILAEAWLARTLLLVGYAACLLLVFHLFVVLYEEPNLRRRFGSAYVAYCAAVPRWGLTWHPYRPAPA